MNGTSASTRSSVAIASIAFLLIACLYVEVSAKKGCSSFGHSCYGGHGKRSDPDTRDTPNQFLSDYESSRFAETDGLEQVFPENYSNRQERQLIDSARDHQDPLSLLVRKWLTTHRLNPVYSENE